MRLKALTLSTMLLSACSAPQPLPVNHDYATQVANNAYARFLATHDEPDLEELSWYAAHADANMLPSDPVIVDDTIVETYRANILMSPLRRAYGAFMALGQYGKAIPADLVHAGADALQIAPHAYMPFVLAAYHFGEEIARLENEPTHCMDASIDHLIAITLPLAIAKARKKDIPEVVIQLYMPEAIQKAKHELHSQVNQYKSMLNDD